MDSMRKVTIRPSAAARRHASWKFSGLRMTWWAAVAHTEMRLELHEIEPVKAKYFFQPRRWPTKTGAAPVLLSFFFSIKRSPIKRALDGARLAHEVGVHPADHRTIRC